MLKPTVLRKESRNSLSVSKSRKLSSPAQVGGVSKSQLRKLMPNVARTEPNAPKISPTKVGARRMKTQSRSRPNGFRPACIIYLTPCPSPYDGEGSEAEGI